MGGRGESSFGKRNDPSLRRDEEQKARQGFLGRKREDFLIVP